MRKSILYLNTKITFLLLLFASIATVEMRAQACDADPGTVSTTNANNFVCNLADVGGMTTFNVVTNNDFNAAPADPCLLAGTPGVGYLVYTGTPNGGDPTADPNFTGAALGSGPALDPGVLVQNLEYSYDNGAVGPISWGNTAGDMATNYNVTYQVCPLYYFDEASALVSVDYDCGGPTQLCGPVVGTDCIEFTVMSPIAFSNDNLACGADPYLATFTVDVSGSYPAYNAATGLDPLGDVNFTVTNTGGNGTLTTPTVAENGTITMTDIANGPFEITVTAANGCVQTFAGVWNQPTITLTPTSTTTCEFADDCATGNTIDLTGMITPQLGRFVVCGSSDGFSDETTWVVTNSAGAAVWNGGPGPGGTTVWNETSPGLDPNDTYFITFFDGFGDGWSCLPTPTLTVNDDNGAGCGGAAVYAYGAGDWEGTFCGDTDDANFPDGSGTTFGPFPLGSPTPFIDPIGVISGTGVTDNGDNTGVFDADAAGPGVHTVSYDYTDSQGCVLNEEVMITVNANPAAPVADPANPLDFCPGDPTALSVVDDIVAAPDADPTTADVASYLWYADDGFGNPDIAGGAVSTGPTFDPGENAGTWYVRAVSHDGCLGCFTPISLAAAGACTINCDADPGTVSTSNATNFVCNLADFMGTTTFNVTTNGDFEMNPSDPCGLAGTPGVGYLVYSGTPNGGDPTTDPNFTGAQLGSGPALDPGTLMQNIEYSFDNGAVGPISWGNTAGDMATNYNITYQICPLYYFDEASSLTAVDYDCGLPEQLCGPVVGTDCIEFTVMSPITFSNDALACGPDPYLATLTVDVGGGYPNYNAATGLDPLADNQFSVTNTGGNGTLTTPTVGENGTITLTDIANGPYELQVTDANGCVQTFAGVWNQPVMTLAADNMTVCEFAADCATPNVVNLTGTIVPQLGRFVVCGGSDGFSDETTWTVTNSAGAAVWNGGPGPGGSTVWNETSPGLDPNDTYFITFFDGFGDGWSCLPTPTLTVNDDNGAGCGGAAVYAYGAGDWEGTFCGDTDDANFPDGSGTTFGPFPLGSPTAFLDPIGIISGAGVTDNGDNTGSFDADAAGPGVHTVSFDYTDTQGCILNETVMITVNANPAAPVADPANPTEFCPGDPTALAVTDESVAAPDADPATADVASYEWYADDGFGNPDIAGGTVSTSATFDPGENAGTWHVRAVSHDGCFSCFTMISLAESNSCCDIMLVSATPTAEICPNDNDGTITIVATFTGTITYSIDGGATFSSMTTFTGLADGNYTVVVQGNGDANCQASTVVTVNPGADAIPPTITCPADDTFEWPAGFNTAPVGPNTPQDPSIDPTITGMPTTADNCGVASVDYQDVITGPTPANCPNLWIVERTWTVTDENGLTNSCVQTFTFTDTTPPTITCPADPPTAVFNAGFNTAAVGPNTPQDPSIDPATTGMPTTADNCAVASVDYQDVITGPSNDCAMIYIVERTWTVTDACGLTADCVQTFIFNGNIAIGNIQTTPEICLGTPTGSITINATSNNPPLEYSIDGGVTFSASNAFLFLPAGTYNVVVRDVNAPACAVTDVAVIAPGAPCVLEIFDPCVCLDNATPIDLDAGTGGDDGQFAEEVVVRGPNNTPLPPGLILSVTTGTTGAFDAYNVPPTGTQSAGVPIPVDGSVTLTYDPADGFYKIPFVHTESVGYTIFVEGPFAFGDANNITLMAANTCSYPDPIINPPLESLYCPNAAAVPLGGSAPGGADDITFIINGNPAVVFDPVALGVGMHTVYMVYDGAADGFNGVSPDGTTPVFPGCVQDVFQVVEVNDITPPNAVCQNITIELDEDGNASIVEADIDNGSNDNCGIADISLDLTSFDCNSVGDNTVTLTVIDVLDNVSTCTATVTVEDNIAPQILCRPPMNTCADGDICGTINDLLPPIFLGDNCAADENDLIITQDGPAIFPVGPPTIVTWTVQDQNGNVSTCTQTATVVDYTGPAIECGNTFTAYTSWTNCGYPSSLLEPATATDACGVASLTNDAPPFFTPGDYMVNWVATDFQGNDSLCMQWVKIIDATEPKLTFCPEDVFVEAETQFGASATWTEPTAMDNCPGPITWVNTHSPGDDFLLGETEVTYTGYDPNGNFVECVFTVTVGDVPQPLMSITCMEDLDISLNTNQAWSTFGWNPPLMDSECEDCDILEGDDFAYIGTLSGHQYYVYTGENITWQQANSFAQNLNSELVILDDLKEIPMIQNELPEGNYYIGLIDEDGDNHFTWVNDSVYNETLYEDFNNELETPMGVMMNEEGDWVLTTLTDSLAKFVFEKVCIDVEMTIIESVHDTIPELAEPDSLAYISYELEDACGNHIGCEFPVTLASEAVDYCQPTGIDTDEDHPYFINSFTINGETNESGDDEGYGDFTNQIFVVEQGEFLNISTTFGPEDNELPLYCRLWIDLNQDGDFYDEGELKLQGVELTGGSNLLVLPQMSEDVLNTRLRIAVSRLTYPEPCGDFFNGEVEDYTISIVKPNDDGGLGKDINAISGNNGGQFQLFPNPVNDELIIQTDWAETIGMTISMYDNLGRQVYHYTENERYASEFRIATRDLNNGVYWVQIMLSDGQQFKEKVVKVE